MSVDPRKPAKPRRKQAKPAEVAKTIVSPDAVAVQVNGAVLPAVSLDGGKVVLIPMPEWKQCAQRGIRSSIQALTFLLGGGTLTLFLAQFGITPNMVAQLPTFGNVLGDAIVASILFGVLAFVWNFIEFWLDVDVKWPTWRA